MYDQCPRTRQSPPFSHFHSFLEEFSRELVTVPLRSRQSSRSVSRLLTRHACLLVSLPEYVVDVSTNRNNRKGGRACFGLQFEGMQSFLSGKAWCEGREAAGRTASAVRKWSQAVKPQYPSLLTHSLQQKVHPLKVPQPSQIAAWPAWSPDVQSHEPVGCWDFIFKAQQKAEAKPGHSVLHHSLLS